MSKAAKPGGGGFHEIVLNVLGYHDDGDWVALALDMDLRGYGKTFESALKELENLIKVQIGFALQMNQPAMIWKPAEPRYFDIFSRLREESIKRLMVAHGREWREAQAEYRVGGLTLPGCPPQSRTEFAVANAQDL